jgi:dTMP kinase
MGFFITFEGIEGCGKSTQLQRLAARLQAAGEGVLVTREPGGCAIADALRALLLDSANSAMAPTTELLLYAAARAQHVAEVIRPALDAGRIVLCDRFSDATLAYQGYGRGLDRPLIGELNRVAAGGLVPDVTLLLDFPAEEGLNRARQRNAGSEGPDEGRFEAESLPFHRRVRGGYLELAATEPRFRIIDARGDQATVAGRIDVALAPLLAARRPA